MKIIKIKSSGTSLYFELEDSTGQKNPRLFTARDNQVTIIPVDYAKSFYNSPALMSWISDGKLIITQGKEQLEEQAIEEQYLTEPITPVNHAEMLNILKGNNLTKIKEIFTGENKELALELASLHSGDLTQTVVGYIEDEVGLSLSND